MNTSRMSCVIDATTRYYLAKGKKLEVIARYLKMKYRISIDVSVLRKRVSNNLLTGKIQLADSL